MQRYTRAMTFVAAKKELKFIHITKCAGTFIEDLGKTYDQLWGRNHTEYYHIKENRVAGDWHGTFDIRPLALQRQYDWFMVVRNPYDRIISEFYCKWGGKGASSVKTVDQFNQFVRNRISSRPPHGGHYTEQHKYLSPYTTIHVIHFENLKEEMPILLEKYGITVSSDEFDTKTNVHSRLANKQKQPRMFSAQDFDKETLRFINEVYAKDFMLFGYAMR